MNADQFSELDLRRFAAVLRARALLILVLVVGAFVAVFVLTSLRPAQYRSSADVRVADSSATSVLDSGRSSKDSERAISNEIHILGSRGLRKAIDAELGQDAKHVTDISAESVEGTDIMRITAVADSAELAAEAADVATNIYVAQRRQQTRAVYDRRAEQLRASAEQLNDEIDQIDASLASGALSPTESTIQTARRASLEEKQTQLQTTAVDLDLEGDLLAQVISPIDAAEVPKAPFEPRPFRDATLAALIALVLGCGLAILLDRLNTRITNIEQIELVAEGVPVLGSIPVTPSPGRHLRQTLSRERRLVKRNSPSAEAYRTLQTSLRFSSLGKAKQRIAITSSHGGEGKTTVTANLAMVLAESGLRVVVVSADLRRPMIGSIFGVDESEKGLTSVLLGDASLADCLVPVTFESGRSLYVLPSGPLPHNPAELLGSAAFGTLLERIEAAGVDFILLDSAPVLPVADPLAIAQHVDGLVILALAHKTRQRSLQDTIDRLRQVEADIIGVVLNGVREKPGKGYRYYGYSAYTPLPPAPPANGNGGGNGAEPRPPTGNGSGLTARKPPAPTAEPKE